MYAITIAFQKNSLHFFLIHMVFKQKRKKRDKKCQSLGFILGFVCLFVCLLGAALTAH